MSSLLLNSTVFPAFIEADTKLSKYNTSLYGLGLFCYSVKLGGQVVNTRFHMRSISLDVFNQQGQHRLSIIGVLNSGRSNQSHEPFNIFLSRRKLERPDEYEQDNLCN